MALLSSADAIAALNAAGHRAMKSPARSRVGCQTGCYLVDGQYVNLGRLRQLAREVLSPKPAVAEPAAAKSAALLALEALAAGGPLNCATWQALGWPFEGFLAWAQDRDADRRLELMRETIRERGAAACLDLL
jgi:hypothetical protein